MAIFFNTNCKYIKNYLTIKKIKIDDNLDEFILATKKALDNFFEFQAKDPLIFFLDTREDLDLIWGKKTENWFVGAFKNNSIYILNPDIYARESSHDKEEFWQTFKHEYCHAYYTQITKSHFPVWFNEGLASFVSGKKLVLKDAYEDKLLDVFKYFDKADREAYSIGQFWIELLVSRFEKEKLLKLIKSFDSGINESNFADNFHNIYGFEYSRDSFANLLIN